MAREEAGRRAFDLIPPEAAGSDPVFLYGTLADPLVLERLLGRRLAPGELVPARLRGHRRVRARVHGYPVLVPDPAGTVEGVLLLRPSAEDIRRLDFYEEDEYRAVRLEVERGAGDPVTAWVFVHREEVDEPGEEPWDPRAWDPAERARLLADIDRWLEEYEAERAAATAGRDRVARERAR